MVRVLCFLMLVGLLAGLSGCAASTTPAPQQDPKVIGPEKGVVPPMPKDLPKAEKVGMPM